MCVLCLFCVVVYRSVRSPSIPAFPPPPLMLVQQQAAPSAAAHRAKRAMDAVASFGWQGGEVESHHTTRPLK